MDGPKSKKYVKETRVGNDAWYKITIIWFLNVSINI